MILRNICLSLSDVLRLVSLGPSKLLQMALFYSFLRLSSIPLCICVCVCVRYIFQGVHLKRVIYSMSITSQYTHSSYSCLENPHGQRSLVSYSPWDHKESDPTERLSTAQHVAVEKEWLEKD